MLDEIDALMIKTLISNPSITDAELGKIIGLGRQATNERRNKPFFKAAIMEYMKPAEEIIKDMQPEAARGLRKSINDSDARVRIQAQLGALRPILGGDNTVIIKMEFTQKIVGRISEIIKEEVLDAEIRRRIADRLRKIGV